ncbi:prepilin peptidase [Agrobacterium tumefaciens]|uniref:prepilin peptidase n=1 Tax=Agrobacterium tumefaciens TaxID=358 RepID=UPI003AF60BAB
MVAITFRIGWVDVHELRIPNGLNCALACFGAFYQILSGTGPLLLAIAVACATFFTLYAIRLLHMRVRGRIGLGLGDVKLAGASALWLEPWNLPLYFFIASISALGFAGGAMLLTRFDMRTTKIPFGPFLGFSLILVLITNAIAFPPTGD